MDKTHPTIAVPLPPLGSSKQAQAGSPPRLRFALAPGRASSTGATLETRPGSHSSKGGTA